MENKDRRRKQDRDSHGFYVRLLAPFITPPEHDTLPRDEGLISPEMSALKSPAPRGDFYDVA